jgi:hypothetical protein
MDLPVSYSYLLLFLLVITPINLAKYGVTGFDTYYTANRFDRVRLTMAMTESNSNFLQLVFPWTVCCCLKSTTNVRNNILLKSPSVMTANSAVVFVNENLVFF